MLQQDPLAALGVEQVCVATGIAGVGYTPHVAPGSPVVTFSVDLPRAQLQANQTLFSQDVRVIPSSIITAAAHPDATCVIVDTYRSPGNITTADVAVAFNYVPVKTAEAAANLFVTKLQAGASMAPAPGMAMSSAPSMSPFSNSTSGPLAMSTIRNINQANATGGEASIAPALP